MLTVLFVAALVVVMLFQHLLLNSFYPWLGLLPNDPMLAALAILDKAPVIVRLYFTSPHLLAFLYVLTIVALTGRPRWCELMDLRIL